MRVARPHLSDYELLDVIATGAQSVVQRAVDRRTGAIVAIKQVTSPAARRHSRREAALLTRVHHPALPVLYTVHEDDDATWLVMEYIPGDDLAVQIERRAQPFPVHTVLAWADQLLDALIYLHAYTPPIVHSDIKPRNLKVDAEQQVRLLDFGIAHHVKGDAAGYTLAYAAPEQVADATIDPRTDLYALAATFYDLLTGVKPPDARLRLDAREEGRRDPLLPASAWNPVIPPNLDAVLRQGMALDPAQRFTNAAEMREALRACHNIVLMPETTLPSASLIGRTALLTELRRCLLDPEVRLVSLVGPGGVGKTVVAQAAAHELTAHFAAGVVSVAADNMTHPDALTASVSQALAKHPFMPSSTLTQRIGNQPLLLVLDACDDLGDAAHILTIWLAECPQLKVLTTSRRVLPVPSAHTIRVPPLPLPVADAALDLATVQAAPAVQLFVNTAQLGDPAFQVTAENLVEVVELCTALDGLPLALKLAALQTPYHRLADILPLLEAPPTDHPDARSASASIAALQASWERLTPTDQAWLMQLSIFVDGCTVTAAAAICRTPGEAAPSAVEAQQRLATLVDCSLLHLRTANGVTRYALLQTVRRFAGRLLTASGQAHKLHWRYARYFTTQALVEDTHATPSAERLAWLRAEHENLLAVLAWFEAQSDAKSALQLAASLWRCWEIRGEYRLGLDWLTRSLNMTTHVPDDLHRQALAGAGALARDLSRYPEARRYFEQALVLARDSDDRATTAQTLNSLGTVAFYQEDHDVAVRYFEEALTLFERLGNQRGAAGALNNLALLAEGRADYARAAHLHAAALTAFQTMGDQVNAAYSLGNLGVLAEKRGDLNQAITLYQESLQLHQATGEQWGIAATLANLGSTLDRCGQHADAYTLLVEGLHLFVELGDQAGAAQILGTLGRNAYHRHEPESAVRCLAKAETVEKELQTVLLATDRTERTQLWEDLHTTLGDAIVAAIQSTSTTTPLTTLLKEMAPTP